MLWKRFVFSLAVALWTIAWAMPPAAAQTTPAKKTMEDLPPGAPVAWVQAASENELRIVDDDGSFPLRYLARKIDSKGEVLRDTIESRDGSVARLVSRDGRPLTAAEDADERERLTGLIDAPSIFERHHKRNVSARAYSSELIRLMPKAMMFSYAPGQPQPTGSSSTQVVIDFRPDPNFQPPTIVSDLLTGIEGRLWIDARAHVVTRGEARVVKAVNFGWGMLAHIYPGGTIEFEQMPIGDGHWIYSHVDEHLKIREVMVKTVSENSTMTASNVRKLPDLLSYQDAIRTLLQTPLPPR